MRLDGAVVMRTNGAVAMRTNGAVVIRTNGAVAMRTNGEQILFVHDCALVRCAEIYDDSAVVIYGYRVKLCLTGNYFLVHMRSP